MNGNGGSNGSSSETTTKGGKENVEGEEEEEDGPSLPSPSASPWHNAPYVVNKKWGSVVENCRIKELIEDCRAEVEALCEHYYQGMYSPFLPPSLPPSLPPFLGLSSGELSDQGID